MPDNDDLTALMAEGYKLIRQRSQLRERFQAQDAAFSQAINVNAAQIAEIEAAEEVEKSKGDSSNVDH